MNFDYLNKEKKKSVGTWFVCLPRHQWCDINLQKKRGSDDDVSAISPMLKSVKGWRERKRKYDN